MIISDFAFLKLFSGTSAFGSLISNFHYSGSPFTLSKLYLGTDLFSRRTTNVGLFTAVAPQQNLDVLKVVRWLMLRQIVVPSVAP